MLRAARPPRNIRAFCNRRRHCDASGCWDCRRSSSRWPARRSASADRVFTVKGASAPGPAKYDRVRVIEQGPRHARNVLVLVPGTSGGAAYFHPVAADIVKRLKGWRVWSVDRRENLLEDHSVLDKALAGQATPQDLFHYYLELARRPVDLAALHAGRRRRRAVRAPLGHGRRDPRPAQRGQGRPPRRQPRRARRTLARRHDHGRVRDLGLQRPRRRGRPRRPRADRRREQRQLAAHESRRAAAARTTSRPSPRSSI